MDGWPAGGCSWSLAPPSLAYVKVAEAAGAAACTAHAGCAGDDVCGVSLEGIRDRHSAATQCGAFRGYWTPKIACSYGAGADALPPFNCTATEGAPYGTLYHLYMCDNGSLSCYASSDSACCGCSSWDWSGTPLPATATCHPNSDWTTLVEPTLEFFKRACPMSYTYPFDDPSSTFTCATAGTPNGAGYTITYCPGGLTGRPVK
jgi:hypothetical protein